MYNLYTNEIPLAHKLLEDEETTTKLLNSTTANTNGIVHTVENFVDDSNSTIVFEDSKMLNEYINIYFRLMCKYYNINKFKLNEEKTNLMIVSQPKHPVNYKNAYIQTEENKAK